MLFLFMMIVIDFVICELKEKMFGDILRKYIYAYLFGLLHKSERISRYG